MVLHSILFIICFIFNNNISSTIRNTEIVDVSTITESLNNTISNIRGNIQDEQTKTFTESYDGENLEIINASGNYHYTGNITTTITIQKNSGIVHLYLENSNFNSPGSKIIDSKNGVNLIITLIGTNTISNPNEALTNAITANQDITINGAGSLTIISSKNGIKCDGKFYGLHGTLNIRAKNHGISSDSIYLGGININIEETGDGKDGLHAESDYDGVSEVPSFDFLKGFVYIESGTINISNCKGDGIQADSFVYIKDGNVSIKTEAKWEIFVATSNRMKGCFSKSGDTYSKVPSDNVRRGSTYYILASSCKGIKVGEIDYYLKDDSTQTEQIVSSSFYTALIEGGNIEIDSPDDSIHTNSGSSLIYGGKIKISTLDDGINADLNVVVNEGEIDIVKCFEGLEAQNVEINGGNIKIISDDDGINAAGGRESKILISGGKAFVYSKGDGIDSNGDICMNGGDVYVIQSGRGNGPIDSDGEFIINGGNLIAAGESMMPSVPSSASKQCAIVRKIQSGSGDISLRSSDSDRNSILDFQISSIFGVKVSYSLVTLSSDLIKQCNSYEIITGTSTNSVVTSGSSTVTSNVKSGWGWGGSGGGGSSGNDGEGCPIEQPSDGSSATKTDSSESSQSSASSSDRSSNDDDDFSVNLPSGEKRKILSTGVIIGIAAAGAVVIILVIVLVVYLIIKKKKKPSSSKEQELVQDYLI